MIPTYSKPAEADFPQQYVLDVSDIVEELCERWKSVIDNQPAEREVLKTVYPEVYECDPYAEKFNGGDRISMKRYVRAAPINNKSSLPDIGLIVTYSIEAIKQLQDVSLESQTLFYDVALAGHRDADLLFLGQDEGHQRTRVQLAHLAVKFSRKLFKRCQEFGLYRNGYFPYHFCAWHDNCVVVELDETHAANPSTFRSDIHGDATVATTLQNPRYGRPY